MHFPEAAQQQSNKDTPADRKLLEQTVRELESNGIRFMGTIAFISGLAVRLNWTHRKVTRLYMEYMEQKNKEH